MQFVATLLVGDEPTLAKNILLLFLPGCIFLTSLFLFVKSVINVLNKLLCSGQRSKNKKPVVNSKERSQEYNLVF